MPSLDDSQDLRALGHTHPAEKRLRPRDREPAIRRFGFFAAVCGLLAVVAALVLLDHEHHLTNRAFALISLGVGGLVVSAVERLNRYGRAMNRATLRECEQASASAAGTASLAGRVADVLNDLEQRQARLEERMQGSLDLIGAALDEVASHLPENQRLHNWRGFDEGFRKDYAEQTGTEGAGRPRARLGIVPPSQGSTDRK